MSGKMKKLTSSSYIKTEVGGEALMSDYPSELKDMGRLIIIAAV
jgi:hypothetical protein